MKITNGLGVMFLVFFLGYSACSPGSSWTEIPDGGVQVLPGLEEASQTEGSRSPELGEPSQKDAIHSLESTIIAEDSSFQDHNPTETFPDLHGQDVIQEQQGTQQEPAVPETEGDVMPLDTSEMESFSEHISSDQAIKETTGSQDQGSSAVGKACSVAGVAGTCLYTVDCTGQRRSVAGYCPGPSSVQCCVPVTSGTPNYCAVSIPASCQPTSAFSATCSCSTIPPAPSHVGKVEKPGQGGCPAGMLKVDRFCIDQYEAVLVEMLSDGSQQAWSPFLNPGTRKMKAVSLAGVIPQGYISGVQAENACKLAGKRLCSDSEWLRACRGPQNYTYPYGNNKQSGWCNEDRSVHPASEYFGHSMSCIFSYISHPCINQLPKSLMLTGASSRCVTAEGVYDMMGNLHEWTSDPTGTFRGGYYVDTYRNGSGCLYRTTAHTNTHWDYSTGFRCCADLPP